jgi:sugar/nucleoside kinase (ribokinase family)
MTVLIAGELNVDLILRNYQMFPAPGKEVLVEDATLTLGSASAICAAGLAKLGNQVAFVGKVGVDPWGKLCIDALTSFGVDVSRVIQDPTTKTGITVSVTSSQDRALITYLGSIAALRAKDLPDGIFTGFAHLHVSSFYLQQALRPGIKGVLARAHQCGLTTSLDPGFDPEERWGNDLIEVLTEVDVFFPNERELEGVTGLKNREAALQALANGRTLTVAKLGSGGCATLEGRNTTTVAAFPVDPVDTTGAGDSFNAGFLHAWLRKKPIHQAMRFGNACAALSTLGSGGTATQPTDEQALGFLSARIAAASNDRF